MLVHRLPMTEALLADAPHPEPEIAPRLNLHAAAAALLALDLSGMVLMSGVLAASHAATALLPLPAFIAAALAIWLVAARVTALSRQSRTGQFGPMARAAAVTCLLAIPPILVLAAPDSHAVWRPVFLLPQAAFIFLVLFTRFVWWTMCRSLLADGFCLQRVMIVAANASTARIFAAELDRRTAGCLRAVCALAVPDMADPVALARIDDAIANAGIEQLVLIEPPGSVTGGDTLFRRGPAVTVLTETGALRRRGSAAANVPAMDRPMKPLSVAQDVLKRGADIAIASLGLALATPVLITIGLAIKLDSRGPILFRQDRIGHDGTVFGILKFRTMVHGKTEARAEFQTSRNDRRVTRIGAFLRRSSLDELPQLVNVLRGDMAIVGPRPHAVGMTIAGQSLDSLMGNYAIRHRMKPGITGWAQVNGCRGELATARALRKRVALDCHYIDNWSFGMDVGIMIRTAALMVRDPQAF
jgi:exopolysaccharide biosynthesis polyprenyl glycosylphosphotransferase